MDYVCTDAIVSAEPPTVRGRRRGDPRRRQIGRDIGERVRRPRCGGAGQRELADRTRFVLEDHQWREFVELLDRPPRTVPEVRELMRGDDVFG
jgi:uncharacterized protein DUF1778